MTDITELAKKHGAIHKISGCTGNPLHLLTVTPQELRAIIKEASAPLVEALEFYSAGKNRVGEDRSSYVRQKIDELGDSWIEFEHYNGGSTFIEDGSEATKALAEFNKEFGE